MRKTINMPSLSGVVAGSLAALTYKIGPTYFRTYFECGGTGLAVAHFGRIYVNINGKMVQTYKDLQRLFDINGFYDRAVDTVNDFALHFSRSELDKMYRNAGGIGTMDVQTLDVQMEILATAPADISMKAYSEIDPVPQPLGVVYKIREYPFSSAVAGQVEIDKLPRGPFYAAVHLFKSDVSDVEVEADQVLQVKATKGVLERAQRDSSPVKRVPMTAKATSLDFCLEGDIAQAIQTDIVQDFRIRPTLATAGSMDVVAETIDILQGA